MSLGQRTERHAVKIPMLQLIKPYERFAIESYMHWGISLGTGAWVSPATKFLSQRRKKKL